MSTWGRETLSLLPLSAFEKVTPNWKDRITLTSSLSPRLGEQGDHYGAVSTPNCDSHFCSPQAWAEGAQGSPEEEHPAESPFSPLAFGLQDPKHPGLPHRV